MCTWAQVPMEARKVGSTGTGVDWSCPAWMLGTKLRSSCAVNYWVVTSALHFDLKWLLKPHCWMCLSSVPSAGGWGIEPGLYCDILSQNRVIARRKGFVFSMSQKWAFPLKITCFRSFFCLTQKTVAHTFESPIPAFLVLDDRCGLPGAKTVFL